jgi:hypothetical protein
VKRSWPATASERAERLAATKHAATSLGHVIAAARAGEDGVGGKKPPPPWKATFWVRRDTLRGRIEVGGAIVESLDHHQFDGEIAAGYHWDVYDNGTDSHQREPVDPQPATLKDALAAACARWNIVLEQGDLA